MLIKGNRFKQGATTGLNAKLAFERNEIGAEGVNTIFNGELKG